MLRMDNRIALGSNLGKSIGNGTTNRYFTTLQSASSQYYNIPTVTLTGDFQIEVDFSLTSLTGDHCLIGDSTGQNTIRVDATNGGIDVFIGGVLTIVSDGSFTADSKFNNMLFKRVGTTWTIEYNGVQIYTNTIALSNFECSTISKRFGAFPNYFNGVISEVKITDGTDLIRYYKLDEDLSATSTIIDSGSDGSNGTAISISSSELFTLVGNDWEGSELVVNGDFSTDTVWTKGTGVTIASGVCSSDGTVSAYSTLISQNGIIIVG